MNNQSSNFDSVELTNSEKQSDFNRFWTEKRVRKSKLLAKKLTKTNLDAIESGGLRVKRKPEQTVIATPASDENSPAGLPQLEKPELHLSMGSLVEDHLKVFRMKENSNYPKE